MAGLEVVVRPVIFPDIRPRPRQSLPPQDDPEKGIAKIQGNPAQGVGLSDSSSVSSSYSRPTETERRVDEVRVYQKEDDGTVNKENFVDLEISNRITMNESVSSGTPGVGSGTPEVGSSMAIEERQYFYQRIEEADNIEIRDRDIIKKNPGAQGE